MQTPQDSALVDRQFCKVSIKNFPEVSVRNDDEPAAVEEFNLSHAPFMSVFKNDESGGSQGPISSIKFPTDKTPVEALRKKGSGKIEDMMNMSFDSPCDTGKQPLLPSKPKNSVTS
mmetsp:Transcript_19627/g.30259  ORF Transcript_19627/g.30259 Transcript_19627/m.30259 type:complete len:116 (+) Transcript_19627:1409-1756(+)|eukprot:CAMPEP_0170501444 /NCGR_PEP_ID=MMETSP0208-20121228/38287_1 /TAXON_ID=197538 /ORGANISM="Strombidium inclinatum, Strain S3" /LENGTH=115 /DNA_ID=CAMNT_0010779997 /DNA_START=1391 /DNA_END=1738 /DNA_ORIENTATION=+